MMEERENKDWIDKVLRDVEEGLDRSEEISKDRVRKLFESYDKLVRDTFQRYTELGLPRTVAATCTSAFLAQQLEQEIVKLQTQQEIFNAYLGEYLASIEDDNA